MERQIGVKLDVKSVKDLPRSMRKSMSKESSLDFSDEEWKSRAGREWNRNDRIGNNRPKRRKGRKGRR